MQQEHTRNPTQVADRKRTRLIDAAECLLNLCGASATSDADKTGPLKPSRQTCTISEEPISITATGPKSKFSRISFVQQCWNERSRRHSPRCNPRRNPRRRRPSPQGQRQEHKPPALQAHRVLQADNIAKRQARFSEPFPTSPRKKNTTCGATMAFPTKAGQDPNCAVKITTNATRAAPRRGGDKHGQSDTTPSSQLSIETSSCTPQP